VLIKLNLYSEGLRSDPYVGYLTGTEAFINSPRNIQESKEELASTSITVTQLTILSVTELNVVSSSLTEN